MLLCMGVAIPQYMYCSLAASTHCFYSYFADIESLIHFPSRLHLLAVRSLAGGSCSRMCLSDVRGHSHSLEQGVRGGDRIPPPRAVCCGGAHAQVSEQKNRLFICCCTDIMLGLYIGWSPHD